VAQNVTTWPHTGRTSTIRPPLGRVRRGSWLSVVLAWFLSFGLLGGLGFWRYQESYVGRIYQGVSAAGVPLGGLSSAQAAAELATRLTPVPGQRLTLRAGDRTWHPTLRELGITFDADATVARAYALGRDGDLQQQLQQQWALLWHGAEVAPVLRRDPAAVDAYLSVLARALAREPRDAHLTWKGLTARAVPDMPGRELDVAASSAAVAAALDQGATGPIELVVRERPAAVVGVDAAVQQINTLLKAPLVLTFDETTYHQTAAGVAPVTVTHRWSVDRARLAELLTLDAVTSPAGQHEYQAHLDTKALTADLQRLANAIRQFPREARFDYDPATDTLRPLIVSQDGMSLDVDTALAAVETALQRGEHTVSLPVTVTAPRVSTGEAAKMNIHGLAASGHSNFRTSPPEREINVAETARRMHGVVIPPGGEFSFNEYLGWVVDATGYAEGYIIVGNQTQVDVGGGVCQVSTTVFRAAFNAGFPITERHAHGYRVSYYEPPLGWDATVFSPWVDLKFKNDTQNYYLVESEVNLRTKDLTINLYGPDTGRRVEMVGPTILEEQPSGSPIYEDDPTLPAGTIKQVDWAHPGATVKLERIIRDAGGNELTRDVFWSDYRPWQARFLRGTGQ